jgi:hypothetical protein
MISNLVQKHYLRRLLGVAKDEIQGGETYYRPQNLFDPVFEHNIGLVEVCRKGQEIKVKFSLLGEDESPIEQEGEAHTVR